MNKKVSTLMILSMCAFLVACEGQYIKVEGSPYEALNGRVAKKTYQSLTTVGIGSLNYLQTSAAQNANHFANFVDGLLTHNDFGTLELNLAESASHNPTFTEFTFVLRDDPNMVWSTYKNTPYKYNGEVQRIKASDFKKAAQIVLTYRGDDNTSDTIYLMHDFIKGAYEYELYTMIEYGKAQGQAEYTNLKKDSQIASWICRKLKELAPTIYDIEYDGGDKELKAEDIPNVKNGSRIGVIADDAKREIKYVLLNSAMYFPTLLTYSTYLPVNEHFYDEKKSNFGNPSRDSILYCGPYVLNKLNETNIVYKRNKSYAQRKDVLENGYKAARIETVKYNIVKTEIDNSYIRNKFESGNIDGFSLSKNDKIGWEKYVIGPDAANPGSIEEPYSGLVNSRWLDTIGSCYGSNLVLDRTRTPAAAKSWSTYSTADTIKNTERALRLQDVRQAILGSIDYHEYYKRYSDGIADDIFAVQQLVHTYVPQKFVYDNNGNEYTQEYYAGALAEYKGITKEEAQALIKPGQYDTRHLEQAQVTALVEKAQQAIADYNASSFSDTYGQITYPITIEYYSPWDYDQETKTFDISLINSLNKRLNGISTVAKDYTNCNIFKVVPTNKIKAQEDANTASGNKSGHAQFDFSIVQWGWGADYGDPLTYMNTYTRGGDWTKIFDYVGFTGEDSTRNIRYNASNQLEEVKLLEEYESFVNQGKAQNENLTARFTAFAKAEVKLIEELAIYKPQVNYGQGWSLSISKSAGYEMPSANYGLANDRLTGMWILKEPLTRDERAAIRAEFEERKAAWVESHDAYNIYGDER